MLEFLFEFFAELICAAFDLDERPRARKLSLGCLLTVLAILAVVYLCNRWR